jgi:hypothetical protein
MAAMVLAFVTNSLIGAVLVASIDGQLFDLTLSESWRGVYNNFR